jgi:hypothetical protein
MKYRYPYTEYFTTSEFMKMNREIYGDLRKREAFDSARQTLEKQGFIRYSAKMGGKQTIVWGRRN